MAKYGLFGIKTGKIMDYKDIHVGKLIHQSVKQNKIDIARICNFLKCTETEIQKMYESKGLHTELLIRWSKLLQYDFFRIYSQHLILFAPKAANENPTNTRVNKPVLPVFKKHIYTKQVIDFILEEISKGEKTKKQIMDDYDIPRATLSRWINKYNNPGD